MQTECPLCESTKLKKHGATANGYIKYCCEVCNNNFIDGEDTNFCAPKINFLRFKKKLLFKRAAIQFQYQSSNFKKLAAREAQKLQKTNQNLNNTANKIFNECLNSIIIFRLQLLCYIRFLVSSFIIDLPKQKRKLYILFRRRNYYIKNILYYLLHVIAYIFKKIKKQQSYRWGIVGFLVVICIYSFICIWLKINVNEPQAHDSYTLQALAWRSGHLELPQDYNWLELAKYQGKVFLSFPPVPTIPMLLLTFFFGEKTPSTWLVIACFFSSYVIAYKLLRRFQNSDLQSATWAVFLICGSSYLDISLFGWVWYMAQSMSFVLTLSCLLCLTYSSRKMQAIGLFCFALSIGCRPLQAIYTPILLSFVYYKNQRQTIRQTIQSMIPILIAPALVIIALGTLNFVRFNSIFEFGITYLPEFATEPQFSLSNILNHSRIFIEFPIISADKLQIPGFGFAFYFANPIFIILLLRIIMPSPKNRMDWFLFCCIIFHFLFLLTHRTFGGWQFGTRYLIDLIPFVLVLCTRFKQPLRIHEIVIIILGLVFNIYGTIIFHSS